MTAKRYCETIVFCKGHPKRRRMQISALPKACSIRSSWGGRRVCQKQKLRTGAARKPELSPARIVGPSAFAWGSRFESARSLTNKGLSYPTESLSSLSTSPLLARRTAEKCFNAASTRMGHHFSHASANVTRVSAALLPLALNLRFARTSSSVCQLTREGGVNYFLAA